MIRLILSPTRSGSTALLRCFENNPAVARVYHQPVKSGYRQDRLFDHAFYARVARVPGEIAVAKETIGGFALPEASFSPLPHDQANELAIGSWRLSQEVVEEIEPLVLLREPLTTWASIEALNRYSAGISPYYSPLAYFVASFERVVAFALDARRLGLPVHVVTLEQLGAQPKGMLKAICERWRIPWAPTMVEWDQAYGVKTWFSAETKHRMATDPRFIRSKLSMVASQRFEHVPSADVGLVTSSARATIEGRLSNAYQDASYLAIQPE